MCKNEVTSCLSINLYMIIFKISYFIKCEGVVSNNFYVIIVIYIVWGDSRETHLVYINIYKDEFEVYFAVIKILTIKKNSL